MPKHAAHGEMAIITISGRKSGSVVIQYKI